MTYKVLRNKFSRTTLSFNNNEGDNSNFIKKKFVFKAKTEENLSEGDDNDD